MLLSQLVGQDAQLPHGSEQTLILGLTADSRTVQPGVLFAALPGAQSDGARFIGEAIAKGAAAVLAGEGVALPSLEVPVVRAVDSRRALALLAARFYAKQPTITIAVTGTNGKTSVAEFTRQLFARLGRCSASLGTIGVVKPDGSVYGSLTTPDPVTLHAILADLTAEGVTHLAVEASSHGLDQRRLDGVTIRAAAFTNLGRDHLDYHPTVEDYFGAKLRLFDTLLPAGGVAVVHADDARSPVVAAAVRARGIRLFTTGRMAQDLRLVDLRPDGFAQALTVEFEGRRHSIRLNLIGDYQATNALLAAGLAISTDEQPDAVFAALSELTGVKGRLEVVAEHKGGLALVDYAHKPEALAAALDALRPFASGKLICVFGCGGDRDKGKRPIMGEIATRQADVVIVTDDNPRSEDAAAIRAEVLAGAKGAREIGDRGQAISTAVAMMEPGDVLLVAGKGHETDQIIGKTVVPFSDHEAVRHAMDPALWTASDLIAATNATLDGRIDDAITGFSIDTRSIATGDVFVALKDVRDGHEFVPVAFAGGAVAAVVSKGYTRQAGDGALLRVDDPMRALERVGVAARARLSPKAQVIAVTGSVGKTGTKEMLNRCFARVGRTYAAVKSYNNQWGVPLTLARTAADVDYAIYEIGMNHAGEVARLSAFVRPHLAIITTVEPVHLGNFASIEGIADAKAEIFSGLLPGGVAIINRDNPHFERLQAAGRIARAQIVSFGTCQQADVRLVSADLGSDDSMITVAVGGRTVSYRLGVPGGHIVQNSLAVVAALHAVDADLEAALPALAAATAPEGRGARLTIRLIDGGEMLLIDESYNANPASMQAALALLGSIPRRKFPRRIAVMGDMLELGPTAALLHEGLKDAVDLAGVDLVFACGANMRHLFDRIAAHRQGGWARTSTGLNQTLASMVRSGDVVMVKGSLGSRMAPLIDILKAKAQGV